MVQIAKCNQWKKFVLVVISVYLIAPAYSQYNITAALPSGGLYLRSQLWNLSISNNGTVSIDVVIQMEMKDIQSRQTVLSAVSNTFSLSPGLQSVQSTLVNPVQYNGINGFADQSSNGFLPVGKYQVCYQMFKIMHESRFLIADDCDQLEVEPLSPPLLTMPENDSILTLSNPNFTWTSPLPDGMFTALNYDLVITEVFEGQSREDAIQENIPLQQAGGLVMPSFSLPLQGPSLEKGKIYAWQIVAKDQMRFAAKSEVWTFKTGNIKDASLANNTIYILMDGNTTGIGTADAGMLRIKYVSYGSQPRLPIIFKDGNGKLIQTMKRDIKQGDNFIDLPLNSKFNSNTNYTVSIADAGNRTSTLTFKIK